MDEMATLRKGEYAGYIVDSAEKAEKYTECELDMILSGSSWSFTSLLFADDTALFGTSQIEMQHLVDVFDAVCRRRNPGMNARKS